MAVAATCIRQTKKCYDISCNKEAIYDIRGIKMCSDHYIEALEHSADIVTPEFNQLLRDEADCAAKLKAKAEAS